MAIAGAMAAAARVFDPCPEAILALDFAGVRTGGRRFYKRDRIIAPRFEMQGGAASVGHAGFGTTTINGAYRPFAPDAPLIGDGGLLVPEAKTELVGLSCRPGVALWPIAGGTKAAGSTYKGIFWGAKAVSAGATWNRLLVPSLTVTSGQLYTVIARYRAGTSGRANIELRNVAGAVSSSARGSIGALAVSATGAGPLSIIETVDEGDGVIRTVLSWTPSFTGGSEGSGIGPDSAVVGEDIEVLGLSIQAGAYVGNPPIDNRNLPATRTGLAPSLGGLAVRPTHTGAVRFRFLGTQASAFPVAIALDDNTADSRILVYRSNSNSTCSVLFKSAVDQIVLTPGSVVVGIDHVVAWRAEPGNYAVCLNGGTVATSSSPLLLPTFSHLRAGHVRSNPVINVGNGVFATSEFYDQPFSNSRLQALCRELAA